MRDISKADNRNLINCYVEEVELYYASALVAAFLNISQFVKFIILQILNSSFNFLFYKYKIKCKVR